MSEDDLAEFKQRIMRHFPAIDFKIARSVLELVFVVVSLGALHFGCYLAGFELVAAEFLDVGSVSGYFWRLALVYGVVVGVVKILRFFVLQFFVAFAREASLADTAELLRKHSKFSGFVLPRTANNMSAREIWGSIYLALKTPRAQFEARPPVKPSVSRSEFNASQVGRVAQIVASMAEKNVRSRVDGPIVLHIMSGILVYIYHVGLVQALFSLVAIVMLMVMVLTISLVSIKLLEYQALSREKIKTTVWRVLPIALIIAASMSGCDRAQYAKENYRFKVVLQDKTCFEAVLVLAAAQGVVLWQRDVARVEFIPWDTGPRLIRSDSSEKVGCPASEAPAIPAPRLWLTPGSGPSAPAL